MFPSPLGVLGLTTRWGQAQVGRFLAFPSPLGVLGLTTRWGHAAAADVVLDFEFTSPLGVLGLTTRWKR
ncbi:hypothetical protein BIT17_0065, partial [Mycobacterium tuberculosis variant bovis]